MKLTRIAVVGALSQIGAALLPLLSAQGAEVLRIGRESAADTATHRFHDRQRRFDPPLEAADAIISLAPLPVIDAVLRMADALGATRVIAFGSASRFSKAGSTSALEREFVAQQQQGETTLATQAAAATIDWTLFRPTMIYGAGLDLNVAFIRGIVHRFGFFPLPWGADGLRQPVHVADLAAACVAALENRLTFGRAYDLGGGETLAYPAMVQRIFAAEGRSARLPRVPASLYHLAFRLLARHPRYAFLRPEMIDRMYDDLIVDNGPAVRDFGYAPGVFRPGKLPAAELG